MEDVHTALDPEEGLSFLQGLLREPDAAKDEIRIAIESDEGCAEGPPAGRNLGQRLDLNATDLTLLATAISEIVCNMTAYAASGNISMRLAEEDERRGIEVLAEVGNVEGRLVRGQCPPWARVASPVRRCCSWAESWVTSCLP